MQGLVGGMRWVYWLLFQNCLLSPAPSRMQHPQPRDVTTLNRLCPQYHRGQTHAILFLQPQWRDKSISGALHIFLRQPYHS